MGAISRLVKSKSRLLAEVQGARAYLWLAILFLLLLALPALVTCCRAVIWQADFVQRS
jgi:hypothetical protein